MAATLPPHLPPHVRAALAEAKARLEALYGDRLERVVLYGSYARGDAREDSDVDLLVVLRGDYDAYAEGKRISTLRLGLSIRHGVDVSMQPYNVAEAADLEHPLMHDVAEDGAAL
jgi:predicted nucleotidyltransferase